MPLFPSGTSKASRKGLLKTAFCLLSLLIWASLCETAQARQINASIKVCVTDESGQKVTNNLNIVLFNTPGKIDSKSPDKDGCFSSKPIQFDLSKSYYALAENDEKIAFSRLSLKEEDDEKVNTVNLKLGEAESRPNVAAHLQICAEDENGNHVAVNKLSASDGADIKLEPADTRGCTGAQLGAAGKYQLTLTTQKTSGGNIKGYGIVLPAIMGASLLLILATFGLTLELFFRAKKRDRLMRAAPSQGALIANLSNDVKAVSEAVGSIKSRIDEWRPQGSTLFETSSQPSSPDSQTSAASDVAAAAGHDDLTAPGGRHMASQSQTATARAVSPEAAGGVAEAKQKYQDFMAERNVEHFYLMPVGSSSASQMVEDAKVTLREQEHGTYVAFASSANATESWVFPLPGCYFTPETFSAVFPNLTAQEYKSGNFEPQKAISIQPKLWKLE